MGKRPDPSLRGQAVPDGYELNPVDRYRTAVETELHADHRIIGGSRGNRRGDAGARGSSELDHDLGSSVTCDIGVRNRGIRVANNGRDKRCWDAGGSDRARAADRSCRCCNETLTNGWREARKKARCCPLCQGRRAKRRDGVDVALREGSRRRACQGDDLSDWSAEVIVEVVFEDDKGIASSGVRVRDGSDFAGRRARIHEDGFDIAVTFQRPYTKAVTVGMVDDEIHPNFAWLANVRVKRLAVEAKTACDCHRLFPKMTRDFSRGSPGPLAPQYDRRFPALTRV